MSPPTLAARDDAEQCLSDRTNRGPLGRESVGDSSKVLAHDGEDATLATRVSGPSTTESPRRVGAGHVVQSEVVFSS